MNKLIFISLLSLSILYSGAVNAQEEMKNNYVVSTVQVQQLRPITLTAIALAEEDGDKYGIFEVVIYGETVKDLRNHSKMKDLVEEATKANIKLSVCEIALDHYKVFPSEIPREFEVVENAFTYLLQLQNSGYLSVEL